MGANQFTTRRGIEYSQVGVGIGIGGVEEATKAHGVWCFPNLENTVYVNKVVKEIAKLVPRLTGSSGAQNGHQ